MVPRINIVDKKVTYRSKIYFTPLLDQKTIDAEKVKEIIEKEYQDAGMKPEDLSTGAVIITGETARKQNANVVLDTLSNLAGDFVVATAGPDLESVLSARGAGADKLLFYRLFLCISRFHDVENDGIYLYSGRLHTARILYTLFLYCGN